MRACRPHHYYCNTPRSLGVSAAFRADGVVKRVAKKMGYKMQLNSTYAYLTDARCCDCAHRTQSSLVQR